MEVEVSRDGGWSKGAGNIRSMSSLSAPTFYRCSARPPLIFTQITFLIYRTDFSKAINQIRPQAVFPSFAVHTFICNQCCQVHLVLSWSGLTAFSPKDSDKHWERIFKKKSTMAC